MMSKLVNLITAVGILPLLFGAAPARAQTAVVDFSLLPAAQSVNVDQIFTVNITVDASVQAVDTVDAFVNFDPNFIKVCDASGNILADNATAPIMIQFRFEFILAIPFTS